MIENHIEGILQELLTSPVVSSYPHHLHLETSEVIESIPMNLKKVLRKIEDALPTLQNI